MTTRYRIAFNRMALRTKLPQGDRRWAEFNDGFDNLTLSPVEMADQIYKGYAFTAWFDGRRATDHFILAQHIAVDMDTKDERSSFDALTEHPFVRMYGGLLYTTPSHTEQEPRARVLFFLDAPIEDADGYKEAIRFVTAQFDGADLACVDSARFLYGSYGCDLRLPDNVLPLGVLRRYYRRWASKQPAQRVTTVTTPDVISLDAERQRRRAAALPDNTPDELTRAIDALMKVDPYSVDYNRWIGTILSMRDTFGDAALPAVVQWAKGKPGEVEREWARVKAGHGKRMNVGTIHYLAAGRR